MTSEYVWSLQPWAQVLIWISAVFVYAIGWGFTWALVLDTWRRDIDPRGVLAAFGWPITLVGYLVYRAAMIGPHTIEHWRQRNRLPRAEARRSPP